MVMQDVNYELFADSVEAECSFGIRNPDQKLVTETLEELGACCLPGTTPEHPVRRSKTEGSCGGQYDLWKKTSGI